ncbi:hypothetical protein PF007_g21080 [Phytophthora fragariae]|uniref:Uncharacterized protein n=1 Tax=Phytophthora fragariae TaxID=53985 RepID=A0A6A3QXQ9_9STRA|nr:hypothetical protein PF007_g21080 [Phytophthora fragariae]
MESPLQLKLVVLVLTKLSGGALSVDNTAPIVSDFLVADLSLARAIELSHAGSLALLEFVWARSRRATESSPWGAAKLLGTRDFYYRREFSLALVQTVRRADINIVQWLLRHFTACPVDSDVVEEAARGGHLWALQLLETDKSHAGFTWSNKSLDYAAEGGHWDVVRWLHPRVGTPPREGFGYGTNVADYAFTQNNLMQLKWAVAKGFEVQKCEIGDECGAVGREDTWATVRFVLEQGKELMWMLTRAGIKAAQVGDLEFIPWLMDRYVTGPDSERERRLDYLLDAAGGSGHISVLEYLLVHLNKVGFQHDPSAAMYAAAKNGKVEVVKWLVERYLSDASVDLFRGIRASRVIKRKSPTTVMDIAASHGHLEVLKFLHRVDATQRKLRKRGDSTSPPSHESYRRCTTNAMDAAASHGHLEVVKWLHVHWREGCTTFAMDNAAANGHLDVVQWLHENRSEGCTTNAVDQATSRYCRMSSCCRNSSHASSCGNRLKDRKEYEPNAFVKGQLSIVKWLHANHWEGCTAKAMDGAAANGNFEMVKWLHENTKAECTHTVMDEAARYGRLDVLKWLHANRSEGCSPAAMENAVGEGHLEVLKWLHANRSEGCTHETLNGAAKKGYFKVCQWLFEHREGLGITLALDSALRENHLELACYLYERMPVNSIRYGKSFDDMLELSRLELYLI